MKEAEQQTEITTDTTTAGETLQQVPARQDEILPDQIHLLPLAERPFFPAQTLPLMVSEDHWLETIERVGRTPQRMLGLCWSEQGDQELPAAKDIHTVGTVVRIHQPQRQDGRVQFIAEGIRRFRIVRWVSEKPPYLVQVEYPVQPAEPPDQIKAYGHAIINTIKELLPLNPIYKEQLRYFLDRFNPEEASPLTDFSALLTSASNSQLQEILETVPLLKRMEKTLLLLRKEIELAGMQAQIRQKVEEQMSARQKEFFLREQLKAIQKELGISKDDKTVEMELFQERMKSLVIPTAVQKRIDEEMQKFSYLEQGSPEYAVTRNYLDAMSSLPWGKYSEDILDLKRAREILDRDHAGLDDIKTRIIEFLAIGVQKQEISGAILLLVGPPGVGKTSIGHSIAEALGREFYRFSLGGMRDEAEIKGHRRTYIGALPGKFIQAIRDAGTSNPVIMLDEVDKIGASYQGDPASALLEVLDPEQNSGFLDHYLDVRFDLSRVLFVCTANQLDTIPGPLLDRMENIRLPGYITEEKELIARRHLWPRQLQKSGLKHGQLQITDRAIRQIIEGYAREAGVRQLEQQFNRIMRKAIVKLLEGNPGKIRIGTRNISEYLGLPLFRRQKPMAGIGIVTGLAWTSLGGVTLSIEATTVHDNSRGFRFTGKLGQVMQESAEIAYSHLSANLTRLGVEPTFFDKKMIHLHVPEGATPKDGPSAGITMATALLSLALGRKISRPLAMTGELTLTGRIFPVGGIREKIVAAKREEISELILPEANRRDFDELPDYLRKGLEVHFVKRYSEVAEIVFGGFGAKR